MHNSGITVIEAILRYAETGSGRVKPLSGGFDGFLRLRVANHRVFFKETADTITIHRVRNRREAYRQVQSSPTPTAWVSHPCYDG